METPVTYFDLIIKEATEVYRRNINPNVTVDYIESVFDDKIDNREDYVRNLSWELMLEDDETFEDLVERLFKEDRIFCEGFVFLSHPD